jgi:16S rRNA (cytosine1402-N4)-methyltransferase
LPKILAEAGIAGVDLVLADLGLSSMQLDDPSRGFSTKFEGPLDMRMNPQRGQSACALLEKIQPDALARLLTDNADEPHADLLAAALASRKLPTTASLAQAIREVLPRTSKDEFDLTIRRVFQALRIAVNDEFSALDSLLRCLPAILNPNGRVVILTFHSGEDRRVKKAFAAGLRDGLYSEISHEVVRPTSVERHANPRSNAAKLRWARR